MYRSNRHYGAGGVLIDELDMTIAAQQNRELVKQGDYTL
jgi:hypothetical protein